MFDFVLGQLTGGIVVLSAALYFRNPFMQGVGLGSIITAALTLTHFLAGF